MSQRAKRIHDAETAYSKDAVAAGIIFMVLSSFYMWLKLPDKRLPGAVVLGLGTLICGLFCVGLRWFFKTLKAIGRVKPS